MFGGMLAANAMECFAYRVKWFPKAPDADSPIDPLEGSNWHWNVLFHTMQSIWTNGLFETFYTLPNTTITSNNVKSDEEPNEQTPFASDIHPGQYCEAEANVSTLWKYTKICSLYLWQFTPDFLTVFCGLQLSQIGTLNTDSIALAAEQLYLPLTFLALIIVGILQYGNSRFNISRFAFANPALGLMGYCSFGIYLFQQIIVNYYFPLLSGLNFYTSSVGVRTLVILIVILFAWLVQKYIVDSFSVFLYNRIMKYIVKENDNDDEGGSVGTSRRTAKVVEMQSVAN